MVTVDEFNQLQREWITRTGAEDMVAAERARCAAALRTAREGYASEEITGLPVLPQWRERTLALIDEALQPNTNSGTPSVG
jgi:hypothetical protein